MSTLAILKHGSEDGIDHKRLTYRLNGRAYRPTDVGGEVIEELLA
ncbi:MAG: hypothetical protein ACKJR1_08040 [Limisphaerales bacterium]